MKKLIVTLSMLLCVASVSIAGDNYHYQNEIWSQIQRRGIESQRQNDRAADLRERSWQEFRMKQQFQREAEEMRELQEESNRIQREMLEEMREDMEND